MRSILILFCLISIQCFAAQEISCWDGDCLNKGWTQTDMMNGKFTDFQCYRTGCLDSGWIVGGLQNINYYTQCNNGSCFKNGWYELDRQTQNLIQQVRCQKQDCLTNGWTTFTSTGQYQTRCIKNDCRNQGWETTNPTTGNKIVTCKIGGCFNSGWIESELNL